MVYYMPMAAWQHTTVLALIRNTFTPQATWAACSTHLGVVIAHAKHPDGVRESQCNLIYDFFEIVFKRILLFLVC